MLKTQYDFTFNAVQAFFKAEDRLTKLRDTLTALKDLNFETQTREYGRALKEQSAILSAIKQDYEKEFDRNLYTDFPKLYTSLSASYDWPNAWVSDMLEYLEEFTFCNSIWEVCSAYSHIQNALNALINATINGHFVDRIASGGNWEAAINHIKAIGPILRVETISVEKK